MTTSCITINCCNEYILLHVVLLSKLHEKYSRKLDVTHNGIAKMLANFQRAFCSKWIMCVSLCYIHEWEVRKDGIISCLLTPLFIYRAKNQE